MNKNEHLLEFQSLLDPYGPQWGILSCTGLYCAEQGGKVGSLSANAKMGKQNYEALIFVIFVIARNCKYANLILYNMHVIVHFLPKKNCFHPKNYFFCPKSSKSA